MAESNKPTLVLPPPPAGLDPAVVRWLDEVLRRIVDYVQVKADQAS